MTGPELAEALLRLQLAPGELAEWTGSHRTTVWRWITEDGPPPALGKLLAVMVGLRLDRAAVDELAGRVRARLSPEAAA